MIFTSLESAADSGEMNAISASLQKMSTTTVDETLSEEVLSRPWPFCMEAPQCNNDTGCGSLEVRVVGKKDQFFFLFCTSYRFVVQKCT